MPNSRKAAIVTASLVGEWKSSGQEWELFAAASLVGTRKMWALSSAVSHGPLRQAHSVTHSFWNIHTQSWHITLLLGMSPSQPVFWRADSRCWTLMTQIQRHLSWEALPLLPPPPHGSSSFEVINVLVAMLRSLYTACSREEGRKALCILSSSQWPGKSLSVSLADDQF